MNVNQNSQQNDQNGGSDSSTPLDKIQDGISYLTGHSDVSFRELITDKFILENTDFDSSANFFDAAGIESEKDLESAVFNDFVKKHSGFAGWEEMLIESSNQYALLHAND